MKGRTVLFDFDVWRTPHLSVSITRRGGVRRYTPYESSRNRLARLVRQAGFAVEQAYTDDLSAGLRRYVTGGGWARYTEQGEWPYGVNPCRFWLTCAHALRLPL